VRTDGGISYSLPLSELPGISSLLEHGARWAETNQIELSPSLAARLRDIESTVVAALLAGITATRATLPALHFTDALNFGTFGDDDQTHHPAAFTVSDIVTVPPVAGR
jgi:hypothetical protein